MFSVLMSVYAGEIPEFFAAALDSISNQTVKTTDFVLVKDGPLTHYLEKIIEKYKDVCCINIVELNVNSGLGEALNIGLLYCKYDVVIRCDSDDINHPNKFEVLTKLASLSEANVAVIGTSVVEFTGDLIEVSRRYFPTNARKFNFLLRDPVAHPSVLFFKSRLQQVGGYKSCIYFEDTYLWLRLLKAGFLIQNIPQALTYMRVDGGFYRRRCGIKYAQYEWSAFSKFYAERLIPVYAIPVFLLRMLLRLSPEFLLRQFYIRFLRK